VLADATPIARIRGPIDTLVIAGGPGAESGNYDLNFIAWIAKVARQSRRIASICTGAFLLAEAGLLDGKQAVTHWKFCDRLAREYPEVRVRPEPIYLREGSIYTSAGITAGIDLSLALVEEDHGHETALEIARFLVSVPRTSGRTSAIQPHALASSRYLAAICASCRYGCSNTLLKT
jgi:transcriptional regulator GlxA family with amidase domain